MADERVPEFRTPKGFEPKLYTGNKRNANRQLRFKQDGANLDISTFGTLKGIIKKEGKKDADAHVAEFTLTVDDATEGLTTLPFSTLDFLKAGEDLRLIIWEVHDTDKKKIRLKFKLDIKPSGLD